MRKIHKDRHHWLVDFDWIREQIEKIGNTDSNRELIVTKIKDNHKLTGTIFFSLNGSPPRGFAIFSGLGKANGKITFVSWGHIKKKTYNNIIIKEFEDTKECEGY